MPNPLRCVQSNSSDSTSRPRQSSVTHPTDAPLSVARPDHSLDAGSALFSNASWVDKDLPTLPASREPANAFRPPLPTPTPGTSGDLPHSTINGQPTLPIRVLDAEGRVLPPPLPRSPATRRVQGYHGRFGLPNGSISHTQPSVFELPSVNSGLEEEPRSGAGAARQLSLPGMASIHTAVSRGPTSTGPNSSAPPFHHIADRIEVDQPDVPSSLPNLRLPQVRPRLPSSIPSLLPPPSTPGHPQPISALRDAPLAETSIAHRSAVLAPHAPPESGPNAEPNGTVLEGFERWRNMNDRGWSNAEALQYNPPLIHQSTPVPTSGSSRARGLSSLNTLPVAPALPPRPTGPPECIGSLIQRMSSRSAQNGEDVAQASVSTSRPLRVPSGPRPPPESRLRSLSQAPSLPPAHVAPTSGQLVPAPSNPAGVVERPALTPARAPAPSPTVPISASVTITSTAPIPLPIPQVASMTMDEARAVARRAATAIFDFVQSTEGDLTCPICMEVMAGPCDLVACGHTACGLCIIKWIEVRARSGNFITCPLCRLNFSEYPPIVRAWSMEAIVRRWVTCRASHATGWGEYTYWQERDKAWKRHRIATPDLIDLEWYCGLLEHGWTDEDDDDETDPDEHERLEALRRRESGSRHTVQRGFPSVLLPDQRDSMEEFRRMDQPLPPLLLTTPVRQATAQSDATSLAHQGSGETGTRPATFHTHTASAGSTGQYSRHQPGTRPAPTIGSGSGAESETGRRTGTGTRQWTLVEGRWEMVESTGVANSMRVHPSVGNVESGNGGGASIEGSIFAASTTGLGLEEVIEN